MKKSFLLLAVLSLMTVAAQGNKPPKKATLVSLFERHNSASSRNIEPKHQVVVTPYIADLKVIGERITHTEIFNDVLLDSLNESTHNYQNVALSRAAAIAKADVIIGALFETNYEANTDFEAGTFKSTLKITVTGHPAVYTNFRNATEKDLWILNYYNSPPTQ